MPIPTFPFLSIKNAVEVELPLVVVEMRSNGQAGVDVPTIENSAVGVDVAPMATRPFELTWKMVDEALVAISKSLVAVLVA